MEQYYADLIMCWLNYNMGYIYLSHCNWSPTHPFQWHRRKILLLCCHRGQNHKITSFCSVNKNVAQFWSKYYCVKNYQLQDKLLQSRVYFVQFIVNLLNLPHGKQLIIIHYIVYNKDCLQQRFHPLDLRDMMDSTVMQSIPNFNPFNVNSLIRALFLIQYFLLVFHNIKF